MRPEVSNSRVRRISLCFLCVSVVDTCCEFTHHREHRGYTDKRHPLLSVAVRHVLNSLIDLVAVGRILQRHEGILCGVLAFEETREERQALLGTFWSA